MVTKAQLVAFLDKIGLLKPISRLPGYVAKAEVAKVERRLEGTRQEIAELRSTIVSLSDEIADLYQIAAGQARHLGLEPTARAGRRQTVQEGYWQGERGTRYAERSAPPEEGYYLDIWQQVLAAAADCTSALELGCNRGGQLRGIHSLRPEIRLTGLEINHFAAEEAAKLGYAEIIEGSILDFSDERQWDMVYTAGVLIHISPEYLPGIYEMMARQSRKYVFFYENYMESPTSIDYQARTDLCWARDFAQDFRAAQSGWSVVVEGMVDPGPNYPPHSRRKWTLLRRQD